MKKSKNNVQNFTKGGVFNPAGSIENIRNRSKNEDIFIGKPEVVAPLKKLKEFIEKNKQEEGIG